jgi:hypothetical protein
MSDLASVLAPHVRDLQEVGHLENVAELHSYVLEPLYRARRHQRQGQQQFARGVAYTPSCVI